MQKNDQDIFFIQKEGIYPQGVFWIGACKREGLITLNKLVLADIDDYHEWVLYKYNKQEHEKIKGKRKQSY